MSIQYPKADSAKEHYDQNEFDLIARLLRSKESAITAVRMVIFDKVSNTKRFLAMYKEISAVFKKTIA